jgi:hypothetical protein
MRSMYLGTEFHRYWAKCGHANVHPEDEAYLKAKDITFDSDVVPWPFDGALEQAKVVICLANPSCGGVQNKELLNELILEQRSGEEAIPFEFDPTFTKFYKRITRPLQLPIGTLSKRVAVLNACPYSSARMTEQQVRLASGLPSVWQAQKYLREVLIPRAHTGNIYLIMIRRLQMWGVTPADEEIGKLRVIDGPGHAISGVMGKELGLEIKNWLISKEYVDWKLPLAERGNAR